MARRGRAHVCATVHGSELFARACGMQRADAGCCLTGTRDSRYVMISEASAECTRLQLDDPEARSIFVAQLDGSDEELQYLEGLLEALDQCLTDQELNVLDWN